MRTHIGFGTGVFVHSYMLRGLPMSMLIAWLSAHPTAHAADIFNTEAAVSSSPANPILGSEHCHAGIAAPLLLFDAVERTLCESPRTRSAWEAVKQAAAVVGESQAAYLPTVDASLGYSHEHSVTDATTSPLLNSNYSHGVYSESVSLAWTLFDFGERAANLHSSQQLLAAAQANQDAALQAAFTNAASDYYQAQAAAALVASTRRIEGVAQQSLDAASARFASGVAPITDKLQAATAFAEAVYTRAAAEGASRSALGTLATDMHLSPDQPLILPDLDQRVLPSLDFVHAVHDMIADAIRTHPDVLAAKAQFESALDNVAAARAGGLPRITLAGNYNRTNQAFGATLGQPDLPGSSHDVSIGIDVHIPLLEGFARKYRIRAAQAAADLEEQALKGTQDQVALSVWTSFQTLQTDTENLRNTDVIVRSARDALVAAQQRYTHGAGSIIELLTIQSTLALAEQQQIQAQSDWRTARLEMAARLGSLGLWAIQ